MRAEASHVRALNTKIVLVVSIRIFVILAMLVSRYKPQHSGNENLWSPSGLCLIPNQARNLKMINAFTIQRASGSAIFHFLGDDAYNYG